MAKMIHTMIRVLDDKRSIAFYDKAFGLKLAQRFDFKTFSLIYLSNPETGFELELTTNADRTEPYDLGDGYGHLAVSVEDLDALHAHCLSEGLAPKDIVTFEPDGQFIGRFFFIKDPDGYEIEVLERSARFG